MKKKFLIYSPSNQGGVRRISENLKEGFDILGADSEIVFGYLSVMRYICKNGVRHTTFIGSLGGGIFSPLFPSSVFILHGFPLPGHYGWLKFLRIAFSTRIFSTWSDHVVAVSALTKMINELFFGIRVSAVIHNSYKMIGKSQRIEQSFSRLLYVGRLIPEKRVVEILRAFKKFSEKFPNSELVFAGEGACKSLLERLAVDSPVKILGPIDDLRVLNDLYSNSDIFISLNEAEPFGIVFLEAMHHGLKIIAPSTGGQREFLPRDYPSVFVNDPSDIASISAAMLKMVEIKEDLDFHWASDEFTPQSMAQNYLNLIN